MQSRCFCPGTLALSSIAVLLTVALVAPSGVATSASNTAADLKKNVRIHNAGQTTGTIPPGMVLVKGDTPTLGVTEKELKELAQRENYQFLKALIGMYPAFSPIDAVEDLLVDIHEVSNAQFKAYLDANEFGPSEDLLDLRWFFWKAGNKEKGLPPGQEKLAISGVSYHEARNAAGWMGKRLPTEYEWEFIGRHDRKADDYYGLGKGWDSWDRDKCCNLYNSARGSEGMLPAEAGAYPADTSTDGVMELCGGVTEWTSSAFTSYPGFKPLSVKRRGQRKKEKIAGDFNSEYRVIRGGSYMGNEFTNNLVYRAGWHPNDAAEAIGFRCVKSASPGLDQLRYAAGTALTLMSADIKDQFDFNADALAAQEVVYTNEDDIVQQADCLAFTHIPRTKMNEARFRKESIETPQIVGVLTTTQPIADPELPAGAYAVYFRGKGETQAQKDAAKAARRNKPAPAEGEGEGEGEEEAKDDDKKKDDEKGEEEEANEEGEGGEEEEDAEPEMTEEEKAAKKALEELGAEEVEPLDMIALPTDKDMLLLFSPAGNMVGWIETPTEKQREHPVTLGYRPNAGKVETSTAGASHAMVVDGQTNDLAVIRFSLHCGSGSIQPEFVLPIEFAPGSYQPMTAPSFEEEEEEEDKKKRRKK